MDRATFDQLRRVVHEQSGIAIKDGKMSMVASRIARRLRALDLETERDYLAYMRRNADEIGQLINVISTNTTHFFREPKHFDFLRRIMTSWSEEGRSRFRIWCAASSTGEEPYTIAMTLADTFAGSGRRPDLKVLATVASKLKASGTTEALRGADDAAAVIAVLTEG